MLQGHIFVFLGKEYVTQKKGAHQRKTLRHAPGTLMLNPKTMAAPVTSFFFTAILLPFPKRMKGYQSLHWGF